MFENLHQHYVDSFINFKWYNWLKLLPSASISKNDSLPKTKSFSYASKKPNTSSSKPATYSKTNSSPQISGRPPALSLPCPLLSKYLFLYPPRPNLKSTFGTTSSLMPSSPSKTLFSQSWSIMIATSEELLLTSLRPSAALKFPEINGREL